MTTDSAPHGSVNGANGTFVPPSSRGRIAATAPVLADFDPLVDRVRTTWSSVDFGPIAAGFADGAAAFVNRLALKAGERVLDVACGTGNLAIPAALAGASVVGLDIAPNLLEVADKNARNAGIQLELHEGNAEAMPYADRTFDTVISMFGAMFAPRPWLVAADLIRVTRPGGRIVMANWTSASFVAELLRAQTQYVPAPVDVPSPLKWGDEIVVGDLFNVHASRIRRLTLTRRQIALSYALTPAGVVELFRAYYGPTARTFAALGLDARASLSRDLGRLWAAHNRGTSTATRVEGEYLEVTIDVADSDANAA